jgi:protocatechuate 3,4-dioxygenase beta subunit
MRRRIIMGRAIGAAVPLALSSLRLGDSRAQALAPTPSCDDEPTPRQTEGPFFTPASPRRSSLVEPGMPGEPLALEGLVVGTDCRPVAGALVDLWHADGAGAYDNEGFRCRGHQLTDEAGRYRFVTVMPGLYPGRTRHFHVKVQAPGGPLLTTQLYFPGEPGNGRDFLFDQALLMDLDQETARFDFVVRS